MAFYKALGWKSAFALIVSGFVLIAAGIIIGQLLTIALDKAFFDLVVYEEDSKFKDPNYEDCENKTTVAWFWNLTNSDALASGITTVPSYAKVGPYNFTRERCEFGNYADGDIEYFRRYWKAPRLINSEEGVSEDDVIINVNPAYLGILGKVEKLTGAPAPAPAPALELLFLAQLAGPAIKQIMDGFLAPSFGQKVRVGAVPTYLLGVRSQALPGFIGVVRASFAVSHVITLTADYAADNNVTLSQAELDFFNDATFINGVAQFTQAGQTFTAPQIDLILRGTGAPLGWLTGSYAGILSFVQNSANTTWANNYMSQVGINQDQFNALRSYVGTYLYTNAPETNLGGAAGVNTTATNSFYAQWVNSSSTINPGFEVGYFWNNNTVRPVGIALPTAQALWDVLNPNSLTNLTGIIKWFEAAAALQAGNSTAALSLAVQFSLPQDQLGALMQYLGNLEARVMGPLVLSQAGVSNYTELGYLQWGTSTVLLGMSAAQFDPTIPAPPEFGYVMRTVFQSSVRFNASFAQRLLSQGPLPFFSGQSVATFFGLLGSQQFSAINQYWGLNTTQATALANYFNYVILEFVDPQLQRIFSQGGGPVVARKPAEWLWTAQDSFLAFLNQSSNAGLLFSPYEAMTREAALNQPYRERPIFRGGSLAERTASQEVKWYPDYPRGNDTVTFWREPLRVSGNDGGEFWPPGVSKEDILTIWFHELARPVDFKFWKTDRVKGINVYLFRMMDKTWDADPFYFQPQGMLNMSSSESVKLFYTRAHFYGVEDQSIPNSFNGMESDDTAWGNLYFGVEPESGVSMIKLGPIQANIQSPPLSHFYPGFNDTLYTPIGILENSDIIPDDKADTFKRLVGSVKAGAIAAYVIGIVLGALLVVAGIFICAQWNVRRRAGEESNVEVELPSK